MTKASSSFAAGAAALLLPFAAAIAQTPPTPDEGTPQQGASFESLDTNSDGRISKTEAEANANVKAQFSSYDLNGDGYIERSEVDRANSGQQQKPEAPRQ
jgi:Ca2+-binding EF-hand superfamily protein